MFKFLLVLNFFFFLNLFSQETVAGSEQLQELVLNEKGHKIADNEKEAVFSKGNAAFQKMVFNNFRLKKITATEERQTCEVIFIVGTDGKITDIKAFGKNELLNQEAERAVSKVKGKWIPAERNGVKVRYRFKIPFAFGLKK